MESITDRDTESVLICARSFCEAYMGSPEAANKAQLISYWFILYGIFAYHIKEYISKMLCIEIIQIDLD
jgi:hypothetical protein